MKKNFRSNSKDSYTRYIVGGVLVCVLLFFFAHSFLGSVAATLFSPVVSIHTWVSDRSDATQQWFSTKDTLMRERSELLREVDDLRVLKENNEYLIELLRSLSVQEEDHIVAGVLLAPHHTPYDTLVIDKGAEDGVKEGAVVYRARDHVLGVVDTVYSDISLVVLASAPGIESTAYLFGADVFTTVVGQGGGVLKALVPQDVPIEIDDVVALPGLGAGIYGRVSFINALDSDPAKEIFITSEVSLNSLFAVEIGASVSHNISFEEALLRLGATEGEGFTFEVPEARIEVATTTEPIET